MPIGSTVDYSQMPEGYKDALNTFGGTSSLIAAGHGTNLYKLYWPIR